MSTGDLGKRYGDGETIIRQGDVGDCMYFIHEGRVEILVEKDGKEVRLRTAAKGEILGEMAIFEREKRSATVRSIGDTRIISIDKKNFLRRIQEDPSMAFNVIEIMSRRIRELSDEVSRLKTPG